MADLTRVRLWAQALIVLHLPEGWTFGFDNAKTRAGLCNYTAKRITVSRYLAALFDDDDIHQVLLHEVAHAMAGNQAGHGPKWKAVATELGYEGKRLHSGPIADDLAPWVGRCPAGHVHYRYKRPARMLACGRCSRRFDIANAISWQQREVTAAARRRALNAG
ncbi:SprT-like domain-containing protein [Glaciihabitans sp. dw_435]|uniref:SprT-like domain-containing protein n=1 Tax=Glaciihabitans sp. dw_435 TaxID=2720081 RepID=UPI001BD44A87|nr:SprT-like domain-containing protein [Glaciihabitans sp. dw_435]